MSKLIVKNWGEFQHYKNRRPPWIKLYRNLLDDQDFMCLPIASKALAPCLWLLASESESGEIDGNIKKLAWRLRMSEKEVKDGLKPLIDNGFFIFSSGMLADCLHDALPETEKEKETDVYDKSQVYELFPIEKRASLPKDYRFDEFWDAFADKRGKEPAKEAWSKLNHSDQLVDEIIAGAKRYVEYRKDMDRKKWKMPQGWLNDKRWEDEIITETPVDNFMTGAV